MQLTPEQIDELIAKADRYRSALVAADQVCKRALPRFNWGASFLDATAIDLLNRVPIEIQSALYGGNNA
jgi:hypothetical protein